MRGSVLAVLTVAMTLAGGAPAAAERRPVDLAVYYATWSARAGPGGGLDHTLVELPSGVTQVLVAFMRPDAHYTGALDLTGTGLEVPYSGSAFKASLEALRARNPGIKILVSVGGEQYANWARFDPRAVRRFVEDFALDGVDLDFEPSEANCRSVSGRVSCDSDSMLREIVEAARAALPRPITVWLTATNTGAYGEGAWRHAGPTGSATYGAFLSLLRDAGRKALLDGISVMAYDAGQAYKPLEAYAAYRSYFAGPILLGFTSPPEAWGGHVSSVSEAAETLRSAVKLGADGAMVFAIGKAPPPNPSPATPDVDRLIQGLLAATRRASPD